MSDKETIQSLIRERSIDGVISLVENTSTKTMREIISLSRIYGIPFVYPKLLPGIEHLSQRETFFGDIPVIELTSVSMSAWERIMKRIIDVLISSI